MGQFRQLSLAILATYSMPTTSQDTQFNVLHHLGGNAQWFPGIYGQTYHQDTLLMLRVGPETGTISYTVPSGCMVDMVASVSRHGSRYPDRSAYNEWTNLYSRIQAAGSLRITNPKLAFLSSWKPQLTDPDKQISQLSTTGYKELYDMGADYRLRYSHLYDYDTHFTVWANYYSSSPRVRDSARLFSRGFLGPNATELGIVYALNASDPRSFMNSLAPSDLCPAYKDEGGSPYKDVWDNIYLPPIQRRLNSHVHDGFNFTLSDIGIIPYLCGFESQITARKSPWCDIFDQEEILQYEYAQDLRYWYGSGLGTDIEKYLMLPVLKAIVERFTDGPNASYPDAHGDTFTPPRVMAGFTNDGQINQLIAALGIFDNEPQLPANHILVDRRFRSSRLIPMRGTVALERLSCSATSSPFLHTAGGYGNGANEGSYIRILVNDAVYPVTNCASGPGSSCPLAQYHGIVKRKLEEAGDFRTLCNVTDPAGLPAYTNTSFFDDIDLQFAIPVKV